MNNNNNVRVYNLGSRQRSNNVNYFLTYYLQQLYKVTCPPLIGTFIYISPFYRLVH